jgi:hypothetical protein
MLSVFGHVIFCVALALSVTRAFAHGEDKPGPHGGAIKMPGSFHTEVVQVNGHQVKIFLLDENWQNPSVKQSSVELRLQTGPVAKCEIRGELYLCVFAESVDLQNKDGLLIRAKRENKIGVEVRYDLPLHAPGKH